MTSQILCFSKYKKNISKCHPLKFLPSMQSVKEVQIAKAEFLEYKNI